jgi:hypothetical protein
MGSWEWEHSKEISGFLLFGEEKFIHQVDETAFVLYVGHSTLVLTHGP